MAKNYMAIAPDGEIHPLDPPEHHFLAVFGFMRLRKVLPKQNPDNSAEEPQYDRFKAWVLIGTTEDRKHADRLIGHQQYKGVTEETSIVHIVEAFDADFPGSRVHPGRREAGPDCAVGSPERDRLLPPEAAERVQLHGASHEAP